MNVLSLWGPVLLIMALIFVQSASSNPVAPPGWISDKAAHFLVYASLGAALMRAIAGRRPASMTATRVALATLVTTLFGVSDEIHQAFVPHRTPELMDLVADASGGVAGATLFALVARAMADARQA